MVRGAGADRLICTADSLAEVIPRKSDIMRRTVHHPTKRLAFKLLLDPRWGSCGQAAGGDLIAFSDHGSGRDQRLLSYRSALQHHRVHPNQRSTADRAAFQYCTMSNGDVRANDRGALRRDMENAAILHARAGANLNRVLGLVTTDHGPEPHARLLLDVHVADYGGSGRKKSGWVDPRVNAPVGENGCQVREAGTLRAAPPAGWQQQEHPKR